ncbi:MAG: hypothetical protein QXJ14_04445 [Candidatus Aenigmatarchaeota archaeon]
MVEKKKPSRLYYFLPIIFGLIGGIAGYLLLEEKERQFGRKLIIVGMVRDLVVVVIAIIAVLIPILVGIRSFY